MAADGYLNFDTKINTKGFKNGINSIGDSLKSLRSTLGSIAAAVGVTFGVKELVETAASVNAANSQLEQTFGSLKSIAADAMKRVADESGIVETRLQGVGTSIYAFAKASGMESAEALGMMEEALKITADSAAYYDRSLEDTGETLKSFLKGNYANDAALGISCTETTRNAAANKMYAKSFSELSEAQKQLVLLQMVKDANDLSGAAGQAAREADGWENVLGNLKETWKQLLAVVGQPMLTVAIDVVKRMTAALTALTDKARAAVNALSGLFGCEQTSAAGVTTEISDSVDNQNALTDAVNETAEAQQNALAGFDKITKLTDTSESSAPGTSPEVVPVNMSPAVEEAEETADEINGIFGVFQKAWDNAGAGLTASVQTALANIKSLAQSAYGSLKTVWNNGSGERYVTDILVLFGDVFGIIGDIAGALKTAWDDGGRGNALVQSYIDKWSAYLELIHEVAGAFRAVWNDGAGEQICGDILEIITNINNSIANLRERFTEAWSAAETGQRIAGGILGIIGSILGTVSDITADTAEWAETLDFTPLLESVAGLLESIEPLADNVGAGLEWFYNNVLLTLASWTIEDVIPSFLDLLSGAIDVLNSVIDAFKPLGDWLWEKFLQPIAKWTGGVIVSVIEGIAGALKKVSDWISKHRSAVQDFAIVVGTLGAAFKIAGIITTAAAALSAAGGVMGVLTGITTALGAAFTFLTSPITLIVLAIGAVIAVGVLLVKHWDEVKEFAVGMWESIRETLWSFYDWVVEKFEALVNFFSVVWDSICAVFSVVGDWFKSKFTEAWNNIKQAFSSVKAWFSERWSAIKGVFSSVGSWFGEKFSSAWSNIKNAFASVGAFFSGIWDSIKKPFLSVTDWFKEKFSAAWQAVKDVFSAGGRIFEGIKDGIGSVFTDVVNVLIDGINFVIAAPFNAINSAIEWVRDLTIAGWEPFSGLSMLDIPQIPRLAQGTVVPANYGEFLAVLGDNKREAEVVSPISAIEEAVRNVIGSGIGGDINLNIALDGKTIYKNVIKRNNESIRMTGKNPLVPKGAVT